MNLLYVLSLIANLALLCVGLSLVLSDLVAGSSSARTGSCAGLEINFFCYDASYPKDAAETQNKEALNKATSQLSKQASPLVLTPRKLLARWV